MGIGAPIGQETVQQPLQRAAEADFADEGGDGQQQGEGKCRNEGAVHGQRLRGWGEGSDDGQKMAKNAGCGG